MRLWAMCFHVRLKEGKKTDWKVKPTWCKQYEKKTLQKIYKGSKKMREKLIKKNKSEIDENGR